MPFARLDLVWHTCRFLDPIGSDRNAVLFGVVFPGKDRIVFVTKEDHEAPSNAELIADDPHDPYEEQGWSRAPRSSVRPHFPWVSK